MRGTIYKAAPSITKEEIIQNCQYANMHGAIYSYDDFIACVDSYGIMDYDGFGELVLFDKTVLNSSLIVDARTVYFTDKFFVPFDILHAIFGDDMKFIWHNK